MMDAANNAEDCYLKEPDLQEKDRRQCLHLVLLPKVLVTLGLSHDGRPLAMPDGVQDVETAALLLEGVRRLGQTETLWCIMLEELGWSCLCRYRGNLQRALLHAQNALDYADRGGFQSEKGAIRAHLAGLFPTSTAESPESGLLSSTFAAKLEVRSEANEDDLSTPQCDSPACLLSVLGEVSNQVISDYSATSLKSWVDPTCSEAASAFPNYGVAMNDNGVLSHVGSETPMKETLTRVGPSRSVLGQESEDYLSSTVIKMTVEPSSNETMSSPHSILVHRHATHQQALAHAQSDGDYSSRQAVQAERGDSFAHYVMHPSPAPFPVPQTPRGGDLSSMFVAKLEIRSESNEENFSRPQYDSQVCMLSDLDGVRNQEARDCSATFPKSAVEPTSYEAGSTSPDSLRYDLLQEPEESDMSHTHRKLAYERVDSGGGSVRPTQDAFATATKCRERVFPMRNPRHPNRGGATPTTDVDDMRLNRAVLPSRCKDGPPGFAHQQANMCTESHRSSHRKYTRENAFCTRTDVQDHSLTQCKQAVGPGGDQSNDFSDDSITRCKEALPPPCCWHGNTTSPGASLPDDSCTRRKLPIQPLCCRSVSTEHSVQLTDGNTGSASAEFLRDWFDNVSLDSDHMIDYSCTEPKQSEDPSFHLEDTPRNYKDHQSSFSDDSVTRCEEGSRSWKSNSNYKSNQSSRRKEKKLSGFSIELPQSFDEF